jgi:hypothetical protein
MDNPNPLFTEYTSEILVAKSFRKSCSKASEFGLARF